MWHGRLAHDCELRIADCELKRRRAVSRNQEKELDKEITAMAVKPLDDRVLVKQSEAEEKTAGGIVLPDTAKEKPQRGKVIAVGIGKLLDDGTRGTMSLKKGDEVYYGKYTGTEIKIDNEQYVILRETDVLAVIEK
jgi:chaperonin GroES